MAAAKPSKNGLIDETALSVEGAMSIAIAIEDVESMLHEDDDGDEGMHSRLCAIFMFLSFFKVKVLAEYVKTTNVTCFQLSNLFIIDVCLMSPQLVTVSFRFPHVEDEWTNHICQSNSRYRVNKNGETFQFFSDHTHNQQEIFSFLM